MSNGIHNNDTPDPQDPLERVSEMVIEKIIKKKKVYEQLLLSNFLINGVTKQLF